MRFSRLHARAGKAILVARNGLHVRVWLFSRTYSDGVDGLVFRWELSRQETAGFEELDRLYLYMALTLIATHALMSIAVIVRTLHYGSTLKGRASPKFDIPL